MHIPLRSALYCSFRRSPEGGPLGAQQTVPETVATPQCDEQPCPECNGNCIAGDCNGVACTPEVSGESARACSHYSVSTSTQTATPPGCTIFDPRVKKCLIHSL